MQIVIPETTKEYYIVTDKEEIYLKALDLKLDNAILFTGEKFDAEDVAFFNQSPKAIAFIVFCTNTSKWLSGLKTQLYDKDNKLCVTLQDGNLLGQEISYASVETVVKNLKGIIKATEQQLRYRGYVSSQDYENRCGNCQSELLPGEKYCKYCGTKRGEGAFSPYLNSMTGLYGPPIITTYKCKKCGKQFDEWTIGRSKVKYCPECGENVRKIGEKEY
ncbi:zinc ribbon domain-containing protein [Butyrivibrio sp. AE3004]|uniref:zinc ribbon domain-containing protein n=1 Tax=Butyrivibrio sp. AE3004 TaxID=1506994 RepID=UPI00049448EE|nr:zinc ribbon domain-containing protein [Butyrivibrio sp. AE3004]